MDEEAPKISTKELEDTADRIKEQKAPELDEILPGRDLIGVC